MKYVHLFMKNITLPKKKKKTTTQTFYQLFITTKKIFAIAN